MNFEDHRFVFVYFDQVIVGEIMVFTHNDPVLTGDQKESFFEKLMKRSHAFFVDLHVGVFGFSGKAQRSSRSNIARPVGTAAPLKAKGKKEKAGEKLTHI